MKFIVSSVLCLAVINPFVASEGPVNRYAVATKANSSFQGLCRIPPNKYDKQVALRSCEKCYNPEMCDKCIVVTSGYPSILTHVTDRCNKCSGSQITLNEDAYNALGGDDKHEIKASWIEVKCPNDSPGMKFAWHKDSNKTWAAFYIVDNDEPITDVRYSQVVDFGDTSFDVVLPLKRSASNFYIAPKDRYSKVYPFDVIVYGENYKILLEYRLDPTSEA